MGRKSLSVVKPFTNTRKNVDLREHVDGARLLGELNKELNALERIDKELEDSIVESERQIIDEGTGELLRTEIHRSTILDKETIAVYHTRQAGRKTKIDTLLKMLNKTLPDLKAVENTNDVGGATEKALLAFKNAAQKQ